MCFNMRQCAPMCFKPGIQVKTWFDLCVKLKPDTMIQTFNNLPQLVFLFLFIAFSCFNRPKGETILKDRFNFASIKVNESEYSCTGLNGSVKYGQRERALTELYSVKKPKKNTKTINVKYNEPGKTKTGKPKSGN